ncbi:hypothetical protein H8356DRAFT_1379431 [Neocallimastix lanati (nom. inval.)]|nr:hypothetical protein H8356DRAFT_1379431 [Neocallimastix sp. JGI-2020a]
MTDSNLPAISPFNGVSVILDSITIIFTLSLLMIFSHGQKKILNCITIVQSIVRKYTPIFGIYFILRIDGTNLLSIFNIILLICNKLPVTKKLNWIKCNSTRSNRYYRPLF